MILYFVKFHHHNNSINLIDILKHYYLLRVWENNNIITHTCTHAHRRFSTPCFPYNIISKSHRQRSFTLTTIFQRRAGGEWNCGSAFEASVFRMFTITNLS